MIYLAYLYLQILALATIGSDDSLDDYERYLQHELATKYLQEATVDYHTIMNKLVFDANMLNEANLRFYHDLLLPKPTPPKPVPYLGVVGTPPHDFPLVYKTFCFNTFMTETEGIAAALSVCADCLNIQSFRLVVIPQTERERERASRLVIFYS